MHGIPHSHEAANILLVDDQPARLLTYRAILEPLGHNLVAVNSGLEALEALMKQEFAVVLLDVKMPGMDGFETAALIHDHPRFESTPIIFVTGVHVTEFDRLKGYKAGAIDYVYIPVVPEILRSKVAVLIELDRQRRALQSVNKQLGEVQPPARRSQLTLQTEKTRELEALNDQLRTDQRRAFADQPVAGDRSAGTHARGEPAQGSRGQARRVPRHALARAAQSAVAAAQCHAHAHAGRDRRIPRSSGRAASSTGSSST